MSDQDIYNKTRLHRAITWFRDQACSGVMYDGTEVQVLMPDRSANQSFRVYLGNAEFHYEGFTAAEFQKTENRVAIEGLQELCEELAISKMIVLFD